MNIKDYWNPSSPSYPKTRFVDKAASPDDWNEDDDDWEFDEEDDDCKEGRHFPIHSDLVTTCGFCSMILVRRRINGETVYVDPKELVKLKKWNEMTGKCGGEG